MRKFAALCSVALAIVACGKAKSTKAPVQVVAVTRQDIIMDAQATGVIQPINAVQVKSKASGIIIKMPVTTGSKVKPGDLLVQIDPRDAQSRYDQAEAALKASQTSLQVATTQLAREDSLFKTRVITAPEHETAVTTYENARASLASAKTNLELAAITLEDVTVRATTVGTIIDKSVSLGTVISSATASFGGGTTLMDMADLSVVYDSALVNETDIGNVKPGQSATIKFDAFPNRSFQGIVEKIEPEATIQQSVTLFPVLIRMDNNEGLLMPGMNSDVSILIGRVNSTLAIPNDAVRSPRDAAVAAIALGLDPAKVQAALKSQGGGGRGGRRGGGGGARGGAEGGAGGAAAAGGATGAAGGEVMLASEQTGQGDQGGQGGRGNMPMATPAQCDSLKKALAKHPKEAKELDSLRASMQGGGGDRQAAREKMRAIYGTLHLDPASTRGCNGGGAGGQRGGAAGQGGRNLSLGAGGAQESPDATSGLNVRPHAGLVFVAKNGTFEPRTVMLGAGNYDFTAVLSGVSEGDQVALISAALMQQARQNQIDRMRSASGLPGMSAPGGAPRGGGRGN